jgi:6-phosphogluconolactonase
MVRRRVTVRLSTLVVALASLSLTGFGQTAASKTDDMLVYFGTYTATKSKGIYVSRLDARTGALTPPQLAVETPSPSFLAIDPKGRFVYAVNEVDTFNGTRTGSVSAFKIDRAQGTLSALNQQASMGAGPAHLEVDKAGKNVLVANYGGGSVAVLPISTDGSLKPASSSIQHTGSSVNPDRQKGPHAHSINVDPSDRFAYVADLGLDKILIYRYNADQGSIAPADPPFAAVEPGAGPRHVAIHPSGRFVYVINEIQCTVTAFSRDPKTGALTVLHSLSTLPAGQSVQKGYSTAELLVHPSGKFLYGSNRGHDSIVAFTIDEKTGRLTYVQNEPTQGSTPRGFGIDPTGTYLIAGNQRSDSVVVFRIDAATGKIAPTGNKIEVGSPVCVQFVR